MRISIMRAVDYWVGVPLCWLLTLAEKLRSRPITKPKRLLVIELSEMGSALIAHATLKKAVAELGSDNVYFTIFKRHRVSVDILNLLPKENIITIDDRSLFGLIATTVAAIRNYHRLGINAVLDFEMFSRFSMLLSYLSGATSRVGFVNFAGEGLYRGRLLTHQVSLNMYQHAGKNFFALYSALSADINDLPLLKERAAIDLFETQFVFEPNNIELKEFQARLIKTYPIIDDTKIRLVLLNPDPGALPLRGWDVVNYRKLIEMLAAREDLVFGVIGLPESASYFEKLKDALPRRVINLTGFTKSFTELGLLMRISRLLITADSGPAHLAAAAELPQVCLFGPETPRRYGPLSKKAITLFADLSCSPCYTAFNHRNSVCTNNVCMQAITVEEVYSAVNQILNEA